MRRNSRKVFGDQQGNCLILLLVEQAELLKGTDNINLTVLSYSVRNAPFLTSGYFGCPNPSTSIVIVATDESCVLSAA